MATSVVKSQQNTLYVNADENREVWNCIRVTYVLNLAQKPSQYDLLLLFRLLNLGQ